MSDGGDFLLILLFAGATIWWIATIMENTKMRRKLDNRLAELHLNAINLWVSRNKPELVINKKDDPALCFEEKLDETVTEDFFKGKPKKPKKK